MLTVMEKNKDSDRQSSISSAPVRWTLLIGIAILFTASLYPNLVVREHNYSLGDVAEKDIKAPKDFLIEDKEATELKRQRAVETVLTVYDHDTHLASRLSKNIEEAFRDIREIFESEKLRQEADERKSIPQDPSQLSREPLTRPGEKGESASNQVWQNKAAFEEKIGITLSDNAYTVLVKEEFSEEIANHINRLLSTILENGVVAHKGPLLKESEEGIVLREVGTKTETAVKGLKRFYGLDQAKTMVRVLGDTPLKGLNHHLINLIVDIVQGLIQPNITLNRNETEERKKNAADEIKLILYKMKKGEMLLREGEIVTDVQLLKLKALESHSRVEHIMARGVGSAMLVLFLLGTTYLLFIKSPAEAARDTNKNIILIACVLLTFFLLAHISAAMSEGFSRNIAFPISFSSMPFGVPIASGAMVICLFMGLDVALPFAVVLAVLAGIIFQNRLEVFLYFFLNGMLAAYWVRNCREQKVFISAGVKLGLFNVLLATAIDTYLGVFSGFRLLWDWAFAFLGGIGAGILTAGIGPLVEMTFGYTTDITLLERANLDQPILRRLMMEAPGTYHHSVIVGSMVEAAASEINANPLLAKVCGYYHDIGKIKQPLYFIENQVDGINRHDKLEPSMSSLILLAHIKHGVEIAKSNKLGQWIVDVIQQHHGTSLISYFYDKAKQKKGEDAVKIDDFRYPGPRPQTREAGLVMLADVVEAASRTLANPTPARIQGLVQALINKVFSDGQLDNCELTLKDLHKIAKSFNTILYGIHHHRIEYSDNLAFINGKGKDGSPDRQQAKQTRSPSGKDKKTGKNHLKRLGQS
jgi:cyclic-di-AMP phosphodiesterase PgpH